MRIGVLSDTHSFILTAGRAIAAMGEIDVLLHAGDHYHDASKLAVMLDIPVHAVVGNCDVRVEGPEEKILDLEGVLFYLTHGHRFNVKSSLDRLYFKALETNTRVVVYGHTHVSGYEWYNGILLFNPGSVTSPRDGSRMSYGVIELREGLIIPDIFYL